MARAWAEGGTCHLCQGRQGHCFHLFYVFCRAGFQQVNAVVEGEALAAGDEGPVAPCSVLLCMQLDVLVGPAAG